MPYMNFMPFIISVVLSSVIILYITKFKFNKGGDILKIIAKKVADA